MSQLLTLFWLRYVIFRNSLTGRREVVTTVLRFLFLAGYLLLSLSAGIVLFIVMIVMPDSLGGFLANSMGTIFGMLIFLTLMTQATGTSANYDPRRFVLFPVSFRKLFALNLIASLSEPVMITILPSVAGILIGRGVALHSPASGLAAFICAALWVDALFVLIALLTAWLLSGRRRETEIFFTVLIGFFLLGGQLLPRLIEAGYGTSLWEILNPYRALISQVLSWTPFGVWREYFELLVRAGPASANERLLPVILAWTGIVQVAGYAIFTRLATSPRTGTSSRARTAAIPAQSQRLSLKLPFLPDQVSAIFAKEIVYLMRNTVTWLNTANILVITLIALRPAQQLQPGLSHRDDPVSGSTGMAWGEFGWIATMAGYTMLINFQNFSAIFAFDASGFRQYLLAPISWLRILLGKNLSVWMLMSGQTALILIGTQLIYGTLTMGRSVMLICAVVTAMSLCAIFGNLMSIHFPYPADFGIRRRRQQGGYGVINFITVFGLVAGNGLLFALPFALSWLFVRDEVKYAVFLLIAMLAIAAYALTLNAQSRRLETNRFEIAEALTRKMEKT